MPFCEECGYFSSSQLGPNEGKVSAFCNIHGHKAIANMDVKSLQETLKNANYQNRITILEQIQHLPAEKITTLLPIVSSIQKDSNIMCYHPRVKEICEKILSSSEVQVKKIKYKLNKISLKIIKDKSIFDNTRNQIIKCSFCKKSIYLDYMNVKHSHILSKKGTYHCNFCLRHNFDTYKSKNTMIINFGGIFSYYYHVLYKMNSTMYMSEILDYIEDHKRIGLENPLFSYDDSSLNWFVDFSRIGRGKRKLKIEDILKTIIKILASFNLHDNIVDFKSHDLYKKYEDAILEYYANRKRPIGKTILYPTLIKCCPDTIGTKKVPWMFCRFGFFDPRLLVDRV